MDLIEVFFSFRGRLARRHFWISLTGLAVVYLLCRAMVGSLYTLAVGAQIYSSHGQPVLSGIQIAVALLFLWPLAAIAAKRLHDLDRSGWWCLFALVPVIGIAWLVIEAGFLPGDASGNRFGTDPESPGQPMGRAVNDDDLAFAESGDVTAIKRRMAVLHALHVQGVVDDQEYALQRARLARTA